MAPLACVLAALVVAGAAVSPGRVPEPPGFYQGPMHGYTPSTIAGGTVIDPAALAVLIDTARPVLLDISEAERKPAGMAPSQPWSPRHHSIPQSVWLPGAGVATLSQGDDVRLRQRVANLTGNDRDKPLVTFCHPDCWASWNAAKRLVGYGYRRVYWMPEGIDGWQEGHPTQVTKPDNEWAARPGLGSAL